MNKIFTYMRKKFHPLYRARRNPLFASAIKRFDPNWKVRHPMAKFRHSIKLFRDASHLFQENPTEQKALHLFISHLCQFDDPCFYDIGANLGVWSWVAKSHSPTSKVYLFEPHPNLQTHLRMTISQNNILDAEIHNIAFSNESGTNQFQFDQLDSTTGSLVCTIPTAGQLLYNETPTKVTVITDTVDSFTQTHLAPDIIKIDVEGAEDQIIMGAMRLITFQRPILFIELRHSTYKVINRLLCDSYHEVELDKTPNAEIWNSMFLPIDE